MPSLTAHPSATVVRLLNIGESGTGKTGSLASLAKAGYRLHILDFDNGLDVLANLLRDDPPAMERVNYAFLRDKVVFTNGIPKVASPPTAWKSAGKVLEEWGADKFTPQDILVVDTLSSASAAAFNQALMLGGRLNARPQLADYGWLSDSVLTFIDGITDADAMNCNVIVNTHIRFLSSDADEAIMRGLPNAKGQEISRNIGKYFNTCVLTRTKGSGPAAKRVISTRPQGVIEVKVSNPVSAKDEYTLETGLADLFADILGHGPPEASA